MKFFKMAASFNVFRHQKYSNSLNQENQRILNDMITKNTKAELCKETKAQSERTIDLYEQG